MANDRETKREILTTVNQEFESPRASLIGKAFVGNLVSKSKSEIFSGNSMETFLNNYYVLKEKGSLVEHFLRIPGAELTDLKYPDSDLILSFSFKFQMDYIESN